MLFPTDLLFVMAAFMDIVTLTRFGQCCKRHKQISIDEQVTIQACQNSDMTKHINGLLTCHSYRTLVLLKQVRGYDYTLEDCHLLMSFSPDSTTKYKLALIINSQGRLRNASIAYVLKENKPGYLIVLVRSDPSPLYFEIINALTVDRKCRYPFHNHRCTICVKQDHDRYPFYRALFEAGCVPSDSFVRWRIASNSLNPFRVCNQEWVSMCRQYNVDVNKLIKGMRSTYCWNIAGEIGCTIFYSLLGLIVMYVGAYFANTKLATLSIIDCLLMYFTCIALYYVIRLLMYLRYV